MNTYPPQVCMAAQDRATELLSALTELENCIHLDSATGAVSTYAVHTTRRAERAILKARALIQQIQWEAGPND